MMRALLWISISIALGASTALAAKQGSASPASAKTESSANEPWARAECRWLGTKTVRVLLRDDLIAGEGFHRFYRRFGCPSDRLGEALGCAVPAARVEDVQELSRLIDACWSDPDAVLDVKLPPPSPRSGEPNGAPRAPRPSSPAF